MSDEVSRLLRETADEPSREHDGAAITRRARRQTLALRAVSGLAGLAAAGTALAMGLGAVSEAPAPQVADQTDDMPQRVARVVDHELSYGTLWMSDANEPGEAAAEYLEEVLGWSTDPVRVGAEPGDEEWSGDDAEVFGDPDRMGRRLLFEAESPDGRPVLLGVMAGEPTPPDTQPEQSDDDRWRVIDVVIDPQPPVRLLSLDGDTTSLEVHEIPDEQAQSVLLLHQDGQHESFLLDDGELEPGAELDTIDLSSLGFAVVEHRATGMVVHFDADGQVLDVRGGNVESASGR